MHITIDIDESQLQAIQLATGQLKKSPAIRRALDEFITERRRKQFLLKVMEGGVDYALTNEELEARGT